MRINFPLTQTSTFAMAGGENLVTPAIKLKPGELRFSHNYWATLGGYMRAIGFERFDGQPKPSEAVYHVLNFDAGSVEISVEDIVDGATSGASGEVLVVEVSSGTWGGSDAAGYLVLFNVTGTFSDDENLEVSSTVCAVADGANAARGAEDDTNDATWQIAAIEATRDDIGQVPGSGNILGVATYKGVKYAFRNNAGGAAAVMHKSSSAGWVECDLGETIFFDAGTAEFQEDETLTGGTSGATATIKRVIVNDGDWGTSDAVGRLVIYSVSGGPFQDDETITSASGSATADGVNAANTLAAGGRFEFKVYNFYASSATIRLYGVDGVSTGFEWDGSVFVPIITGMAEDTPKHVTTHKKHLFFLFAGGSVQHSNIGDPVTTWTPVLGAAEIGAGDETVGFASLPGDALGIFTRNTTQILYGTNSTDWNITEHSAEAGAIPWTIQSLGWPRYLDDRGMMNFRAVQEWGDFSAASFSEKIQPLIDEKKSLVIASMRVKSRNQYRLFCSDGTWVCATFFGDKVVGITRGGYGKTVYCCCSGEDANGGEELFIGSDDGYIYQLDSGPSFDGEAVEGYLRLPFNHLKSPAYDKDFLKAVLELDAPAGIERTLLEFTPEFSYGNSDIPISVTGEFTVSSGGGYFDFDNYLTFYWDEQIVGEATADIDGFGRNMGMLIRTENTYAEPHTIQAATLHYIVRGLGR